MSFLANTQKSLEAQITRLEAQKKQIEHQLADLKASHEHISKGVPAKAEAAPAAAPAKK